MRYLLLLLLTGCTVTTPIWLGDAGVSEMCTGGEHDFTYEGETKTFSVHLTEPEDMYSHCGEASYGAGPAQACIVDDRDIYVTPGVSCPRSVAHELNHGFGINMDRII